MSAMQSSSHSFFDRCSITTALRPQRWRRLLEEAGQHAILKTLDVDLERIDPRYAGLLENPLQPQRRHLDGLARSCSRHDVAGAEVFAVGLDHQVAVGGAGRGGHQPHLCGAGCRVVEGQPCVGDGMRLDRDHLACSADVTRERHRVGAHIGADIDEHAARRCMCAQKVQLFEIVLGIEQRAALGGAGLMIESERPALILRVERSRAQQIDQPRQHRPKAPRFSRERCASAMIAAWAALGANAPNGAGEGSLSGVTRGSSKDGESGACIAGFADGSNEELGRLFRRCFALAQETAEQAAFATCGESDRCH